MYWISWGWALKFLLFMELSVIVTVGFCLRWAHVWVLQMCKRETLLLSGKSYNRDVSVYFKAVGEMVLLQMFMKHKVFIRVKNG